MKQRTKFWLLLSITAAIAALMTLSAGISGLELRSGQLFNNALESELGRGGLGRQLAELAEQLRLNGSLLLTIAALVPLVVLVLYFIFSPEGRRQALRQIFRVAMWVLAFYLLARRAGGFGLGGLLSNRPSSSAGATGYDANFLPPVMLNWLAYGLSLAVVGGLAWAGWWWWRRTHQPSLLNELAQQAQATLDDLSAGSDFRDAVQRCYFEMCAVLTRQRGLKRKEAMTPREFEQRLLEAGLPGEPVEQLTRLFEGARYGSRQPGEQEERQAVACLNAIAGASQGVS